MTNEYRSTRLHCATARQANEELMLVRVIGWSTRLASKQRECSVRVGPDSRPAVTTVRQPDGPEIKVGI